MKSENYLLVVDSGNTNIVFGIYAKQQLKAHWRFATDRQKTADEYGALCLQLLQFHQIDPTKIKAAIMASVTPVVQPAIIAALQIYLGLNPVIVNHTLVTGLNLKYDHPELLGADRLVNAAAAHALYIGPVLIIDLGTATKFCVVNEQGDYLGGIIAPGIKTITEALIGKAAKLPGFELAQPPRVIGTNTIHCMQSGIINGQIAMIRGLIQQIRSELNTPILQVIATGGLSDLVAASIPEINTVNPFLTLEGLRILHEMNP